MYNFEEVIPGKLTRSWYVWKAVFFLLFALSALAKVAWIIRNNHELVLLDVVLLTILAGLLWASSKCLRLYARSSRTRAKASNN